MEIEEKTNIKFDSEKKQYLITTETTETLTQKEMFQRINQKKAMLVGAKNQEEMLKNERLNIRKTIQEKTNEIENDYKNRMPQVEDTIKTLGKEIEGMISVTKEDALMQKKFVKYEETIKNFKEKQKEMQNILKEEEKKFNDEMNKEE